MKSRHHLAVSLFLAVGCGLCPAASTPAPTTPVAKEVALRGPEVLKLDWNTRGLQSVDLNADGLNDVIVINNDRSAIELLYQLKPGSPNEAVPKDVNPNRWTPVLEDARFRKISVTTGVTMYDLAVGDLNGDGRPDLAYTGEPQALTIRYQQDDAKWQEKKIPEAPAPLQFVGSTRIGDVNGDKRSDLVLLGQKELAVYLQEKGGELAAPERYALPDDSCYGLEIVDVDGDGRQDLVYLCSSNRDALRVRLQTTDKRFGPELAYTIKPTRCTLQILSPGTKEAGPVFADVQEHTGHLEVFTLNRAETAEGGPSLKARVFTPRPGNKTPFAYALADFDGDGTEDVAVADPDGAQVYLYFRQKDGGFATAQRYPVFSDARSIAAARWGKEARAALFVASPKEQSVGVATFNSEGRLGYPKPLATTGRPLALAAGEMSAGGETHLVVLREEKSKRFADVWARKDDGAELVRSVELNGLKTDPRAVRLVDANQDGKTDIAVFTPLDAMRVYLQGDDLAFTEATAATGFRRGLVDNLDVSAFATADVDGDKKPEMIVSSAGFSRALRVEKSGELVVVDQFNARDPAAELSATLVLPPQKNQKRPLVVLYDKKTDQFQKLEANEQALYQIADSVPAGKIDVVGTEVRKQKNGGESFVFGRDRFWWLPLDRQDVTTKTVTTHATDLPDVSYSDVIAGDLNADGKAELVCVDPERNLIEVLSRATDDQWQSRLHFKVFETDQHFQGRKGGSLEPRETIVADVTGDGKKDLVLLVHDRILVYPQE